jgi:hypothetical protein
VCPEPGSQADLGRFLNDPSLLWNLKCRYAKDEIYTYTGYILIAINPYKNLAVRPVYPNPNPAAHVVCGYCGSGGSLHATMALPVTVHTSTWYEKAVPPLVAAASVCALDPAEISATSHRSTTMTACFSTRASRSAHS